MDRAEWHERLAAEETRLGLTQGFKMLYGPWATLGGCDTAFLSLNPGRAPDKAAMRTVSDERGNSYEVERLTTVSPLTDQFLRLAELIGRTPLQIMTGVVAPFRSDGFASLAPGQRAAALALGQDFWRGPLSAPGLRLVVAVSREAAEMAVALTGARYDGQVAAGWGDHVLRRFRMPDGGRVVHLPHLSRFRLVGRPASADALAWALGLGPA